MSNQLYVGFTTIPSRSNYIEKVISDLRVQTLLPDTIVIGVPKYSSREKVAYDVIKIQEDAIKASKTFTNPPNILVHILKEDYGPLCKLMGLLQSVPFGKGHLLVTIDDDQHYDKHLLETLSKGSKEHTDSVVCLCGHTIGKLKLPGGKSINGWGYRCSSFDNNSILKAFQLQSGSQVDIVSGWCGVLYKRDMFPSNPIDNVLEAFRANDNLLHRNDDIYISAWLSKLNVKCTIFSYEGTHHQTENAMGAINPLKLSSQKSKIMGNLIHFREWWQLISRMEERGYFQNESVVNIGELSNETSDIAGTFISSQYTRKGPASLPLNKSITLNTSLCVTGMVLCIAVGTYLFIKSRK